MISSRKQKIRYAKIYFVVDQFVLTTMIAMVCVMFFGFADVAPKLALAILRAMNWSLIVAAIFRERANWNRFL